MSILLLYWAESAIVGFVSLIDIPKQLGLSFKSLFLTVFFLIHFGGFMTVHVVFLFALTTMVGAEATIHVVSLPSLAVVFLALGLHHGYLYRRGGAG